jgi:hypothetical protein
VCVDVPAATELGSMSNRENTAQQHAEQQAHQLTQPSGETLPAQRFSQPHQGAGQVRLNHGSSEDAGLAEAANGSGTVSTTVAVQSALIAAHHPGRWHAQIMRQLPVSPTAMTRPFHGFLGSADKQRHEVHRAAAVNSGLVYVPEVGLVPVVPLGELAFLPRGAASGAQSFVGRLESLGIPASQAAAVSANLDSAGAIAIQAAAPRALGQPLQPGLPQLKVLRTMQQFWKLWADGDVLNGQGPLRDLPPEIIAKKKQRYSEWKRAADVVASRVAKMPSSSAGPSPSALPMVLEQLERERSARGQSMATFIKAMGKECKSAAAGAE